MVTYHPDGQVAKRLSAWLAQVPHLYVIDNGSPAATLREIKALAATGRITLVENPINLGIAAALNQALDCARSVSADWLLTIDQDSTPSAHYAASLMAALTNCPFAQQVAIVAGTLVESKLSGTLSEPREQLCADARCHADKFAITSGSMYRVSSFDRLGCFRGDLFIDLVDTEFCLRLAQAGLRVIVSEGARLHHQFGSTEVVQFGPVRIVKRLYPPERNYYRFRNGLRLAIEWALRDPLWSASRLVRLMRLVANIIILHDRRAENLRMATLGMLHALAGRSGPLTSPVAMAGNKPQ